MFSRYIYVVANSNIFIFFLSKKLLLKRKMSQLGKEYGQYPNFLKICTFRESKISRNVASVTIGSSFAKWDGWRALKVVWTDLLLPNAKVLPLVFHWLSTLACIIFRCYLSCMGKLECIHPLGLVGFLEAGSSLCSFAMGTYPEVGTCFQASKQFLLDFLLTLCTNTLLVGVIM